MRAFGTSGTGNGQFKEPHGVAVDSSGHVWVVDTGNSRVQEFTSEGAFVRAFGTSGSGSGQFSKPRGIAIDPSGHVWVADEGNDRMEEFSTEGAYMKTLGSQGTGNGKFEEPYSLSFDATGDMYVVDTGNVRVQEFNAAGEYVRQFGSSQIVFDENITVGPEGNVWLSDIAYSRIEEFSATGEFLTKFGSNGSGNSQFSLPEGVSAFGSNLYIVDSGNNRVKKYLNAAPATVLYSSSFGTTGTGNGQLKKPWGLVTDSSGNVWVADSENNRVEEFNSGGSYVRAFGSSGSGNGQFKTPKGIAVDSSGHVWVADTGNDRVQEFSSEGTFVRAFGSAGTGNGQFEEPRGIAVDTSGHVWVADTGNNRLQEFSSEGTYMKTLGSAGTGNGQFEKPAALGFDATGDLYVLDGGNYRIEEFNPASEYVRHFGSLGTGNGQMETARSLSVGPEGSVWLSDSTDRRVEEFSSSGSYLTQFGSKGSGAFSEPVGIGFHGSTLYAADLNNNRVEKWALSYIGGDEGAHDRRTIYYSSAANSEYPVCGGHAEWANLPCQAQPAQQPEIAGLLGLPVTVYTYNMWDEPLTIAQTVGSSTRTTTNTYDAAGRPSSSSISSTVGTALPVVSDEYSSETGALVKQISGSGSEEKHIASVYNTLGELTEYTDADGSASTYKYDVDGRPSEVSDGKGTQTYGYDETTGELTSLKDSAAGAFTASYDVEGNLLGEHYPNDMNANYTIDPTGKTTGVEYEKVGHCGASCTWFKETTVPSIHGQTMSESSTLATASYTYDSVGRLTQAQEEPAGEGCTTRLYEYDRETNRTSLTTRAPGSKGECTTTGGTVEKHSYDVADRLTDEGTSYDTFGNTTSLPAKDAGGTTLTSTYYDDNTLASAAQNGETIGYHLDPAGRDREIVSTGTSSSDVIDHYAGAGDSPVWTVEPVSGNWTRNIAGISGLVAIQSNGGSPVLQITDLKGNVVATASTSETEEKLLSTERSTEFGVPTTTKPAKYSWLGGEQRPTELPSGMVNMGARAYIPEIGRFEQTDPIPGGSPNPYAYTNGDPVDETDLTGEYVENNYLAAVNGEENGRAIAREAAREQAAREEAERLAEEAAAAAAEVGGGEPPYELADYTASASSVESELVRGCQIYCSSNFSHLVDVLAHGGSWNETMYGWEAVFAGESLLEAARSDPGGPHARAAARAGRLLIEEGHRAGDKIYGGRNVKLDVTVSARHGGRDPSIEFSSGGGTGVPKRL